MDANERLNKFIEKGGVSFSLGYEDNCWLVTVTRIRGSENDSVGGSFDSFEEGINFCLDYLEDISRKRTIKSVRRIK